MALRHPMRSASTFVIFFPSCNAARVADAGSTGVPENFVAINGDFHCDFANSRGMSVWLGAGPAVVMTDPSAGRSNTDVGGNAVVTDQSQVVLLSGGVRS